MQKTSSSPSSAKRRFQDDDVASPSTTNGTTNHAEELNLGALEPFLDSQFDVANYTSRILSSSSSSSASQANELKSLRHHLDTVERAISSSVSTHEDALLNTLDCVTRLKREIVRSKTDTSALVSSVQRVEQDFCDPLARLRSTEQSLRNSHEANSILRKLAWFLQATRKLKQITTATTTTEGGGGGKEAVRAAQLIGELEELLREDDSLRGVHVVERELKWINQLSSKARTDTQRALEQAIRSKNQGEIGLALQAYHHLGQLDERVQHTATVWAAKELAQECRELLKEGNSSGSGSDRNTLLQLRGRMDRMMESVIRAWAMQIWNLQRVLAHKRFTRDEGATTTTSSSSSSTTNLFDSFWQKTCAAVEHEIKTCGGRWTKESLIEDYPRLRKSARAMLARLWTSTRNVLAGGGKTTASVAVGGPKEAQPLLRALLPLLTEFLARSMGRLTHPVHVMFPAPHATAAASTSGGALPTGNDVAVFAQMLHKELMQAVPSSSSSSSSDGGVGMGGGGAVDDDLLGALAKCASVAVQLFVERSGQAINREEAAHHFRGLSLPPGGGGAAPVSSQTPAQEHNTALLQLVVVLRARMRDTLALLQERCASGGEEEDVSPPETAAAAGSSDDDDDDTDSDGEAASSQPLPAAAVDAARSPSPLQKLVAAVDALDEVELDILDTYFGARGGDFAFHALDKVLQEVSHAVLVYESPSTSSSTTSALPQNSFAVHLQRAVDVLVTEHVAKLPTTTTTCAAILAQLHHRLRLRLAMRVCTLRSAGFSPAGRALLQRELASAFDALDKLVGGAPHDLSLLFPQQLHSALEASSSDAAAAALSPPVLAWHFALANNNNSATSTPSFLSKKQNLTSYLNEIEFLPEQDVRARLGV